MVSTRPPEHQRWFGARLRDLRLQRGLTQAELGERSEVGYKYIGSIERGFENPSLSVIVRLARALTVEPADLFDFEGERQTKALREQAKKRIDSAKDADLLRLHRIIRALEL